MTQSTLVITGANRGIGFETLRCFLKDPAWRAIATCRDPDSATALAGLRSEHGDRLELRALDVADAASVAGLRR
jgi:NAD(P)-dependent dehydrogenase (short-subunit alcohol dehydrogenase family)